MVRALGMQNTKLVSAAILLGMISFAGFAQEDPPDRVARLNYISGNVSMEPAGIDQWAPADVNRPFTIGDYLYTDQGAKAELHLDVAVIRMDADTSFGFLNLDDRTVQIKLTEGDMYFRLHDFGQDQVFEVDTPNAAVTLLRDGVYRFRVDPNGNMSFVVVRDGQAVINGGGQSFTLNQGNSALLTGTDQLSFDVETAPAPDDFDNWCEQRDAHEAHLASARYLPPTVIGYEDLDDYGTWQNTGDYGAVWYPRSVAAGWAPYQYGHWAWIEPWGWTWVDNTPWGFAPFHYGRWAYIGNRWGWCPGPIARVGYVGPVVRPYYAPAIVAWFGGAHWGASLSVGAGPSLGWVPLGFGEVYTPPYACSRPYFNNVNVYNTRIVKTVNITNVYNTVYVNHTVYNRQFVNVKAPNAVMAMPQAAFASGRPVHQAGAVVQRAELTRVAPAAVVAPPVAPTRQAVAPTLGRPAPRPPAQVVQRQVVARNTPAAVPAAFTARQQYLDQHAGQVHNFQAMHQTVVPQARPVANVRKAPTVQTVATTPGTHVGNEAVKYRSQAAANESRQPESARQSEPVRQSEPARQPERPQTPAEARTSEQGHQPAPAHGTPPNMREENNNRPANQNERLTERAQPEASRPAERTQPEANRPGERNQPETRPQQPARTERTEPQPRAQQPASAERSQSQARPQQHAYPERAHVREETQPKTTSSREESKPSAQHGQPPSHVDEHGRAPEKKDTRDNKNHR